MYRVASNAGMMVHLPKLEIFAKSSQSIAAGHIESLYFGYFRYTTRPHGRHAAFYGIRMNEISFSQVQEKIFQFVVNHHHYYFIRRS